MNRKMFVALVGSIAIALAASEVALHAGEKLLFEVVK